MAHVRDHTGTQPAWLPQSHTAGGRTRSTAFTRNLKGVFFFLVALILVSQVSPLLLIVRLIDSEVQRADTRLQEAAATLAEAWLRTDAPDYSDLDVSPLVDGHALQHLRLAAFLPDSAGGSWYYLATSMHSRRRPGWDSVSHIPPVPAEARQRHGMRALVVSDIWDGHPVRAELVTATPAVAGLWRQFRLELWLRGILLTSFVLFTILFYRLVLLPFHDMRRRSAALVESGVIPPGPDGTDQDPEYVMATFDHLVHKLSRQAGQMELRALDSERRVRDVERFNEYILTSMTTGMIILDREGEILRFNRAAELILRMPAAAMIGRHYSQSGLADNLLEMFTAGLERGEVFSRHELRVDREGGEPIYLGINTSCIKSDTDETVGLSILLTDLTAIKKLQEEVAENQRLADLGELAAGLAHQLRNSMAAILGYGRLLRQSAPEEGRLGDWAEGLLSETAETSEMITRFLDFARPLHAEKHTVHLGELLDSATGAVRAQADAAGVQIETPPLPERAPCVSGDELLLKQVFVNLLQNAIEASRPGSRITIAISHQTANGGRWVVSVADQGCGIPPDAQGRIFHPFYTTKDAGTGLGLALARKIVVSHGGSLILQSSTPQGSTFLVTLPACTAPVVAPAVGAPA
jgi:PAS domain S-box-containing protein